MGLNDEIEASGMSMLQAILFGFATAKTEGLTSQDLVEAIVARAHRSGGLARGRARAGTIRHDRADHWVAVAALAMRRAGMRLTDKGVAALPAAPAGKRLEIWDDLVAGFGVRVTDTGHKSFVAYARFHGVPSRRTIGTVGKVGLADARAKARLLLEAAIRGEDPAADAPEARARTFGEALETVYRQARSEAEARKGYRARAPKLSARRVEAPAP